MYEGLELLVYAIKCEAAASKAQQQQQHPSIPQCELNLCRCARAAGLTKRLQAFHGVGASAQYSSPMCVCVCARALYILLTIVNHYVCVCVCLFVYVYACIGV